MVTSLLRRESKSDRLLREAEQKFTELSKEANSQSQMFEFLTERLADLELQLEDAGWTKVIGATDRELSRDGLTTINKLARLYFLKNPLIKRAVLTQAQYVFSQGMNIQAEHPLVNQLIQDFLDDPKNKKELTEQQARMVKEIELQCFGNLFFAFFINKQGGKVRVRSIPCDEIQEIITNPEDRQEPWYYKRVWTQSSYTDGGSPKSETKMRLYPDWRYKAQGGIPTKAFGEQVENVPVYHVAVNKLSDMQFGVSEIYAAIDWARAYKEFLENWATIVKSYARFAWKATLPSKDGTAQVAAMKAKLGTTLTTGTEKNPAPVTASTFIGTPGVDMQPIKTAGATTSAEDGRYLRLMVCAATGVWDHYLTGDPSTGNLATTKTMEAPMLIQFRSRQQLWISIYLEMLQFVIDQSARYGGPVKGAVSKNEEGEEVIELAKDSENEDPAKASEPIDRTVNVTIPDILEKDIMARVNAVVAAATLNGQPVAGTIEAKLLTRLLLEALGIDDVDEILDQMFPPEGTEGMPSAADARETQFLEAIKVVKKMVEKLTDPKVLVSA